MTKPFEGVRVIDFTQVYAGPFASYQLALHGADVVKSNGRAAKNSASRRTHLNGPKDRWGRCGWPLTPISEISPSI